MFSCWFTDDQPTAVQRYPEHTPLHLKVRQESYQWEEEKFYNFVGVEYMIKNTGIESIEDLYVGFFADGDAGPRTREQYWLDDGTGLYEGIVCALLIVVKREAKACESLFDLGIGNCRFNLNGIRTKNQLCNLASC